MGASIEKMVKEVPEDTSFGKLKYRPMLFSLLYLENYRGITQQVFDLDHLFTLQLGEKQLKDTKKNENVFPHFYGEEIYSLSCIVGKNGTGKTSIIDFLRETFFKLIKIIDESSIACTEGYVEEDDYEKYATIGSIIEKEASTDEDRSLVSSVIYNRLKSDMLLQIDATVVYALGNPKINIVTYKDLQVDSPYNTYLNKGLTIGPICNPGKESLLAAIKPDNTDYLYYVLTENGSHFFTNNYQDFLKKKEELNVN